MGKRCLAIGINNYNAKPLKFASADAERCVDELAKLDFQCMRCVAHADKDTVEQSINLFVDQFTETDDLVIVNYNGHCEVSAEGEPFLVPLDGEIDERQRVPMSRMIHQVASGACSQSATCLFLMNCCRCCGSENAPNNLNKCQTQLKKSHVHRSISIIWACSSGYSAADGEMASGCSVFARSFAKSMGQRLSVLDLFERIRDAVQSADMNRPGKSPQRPWLCTDSSCKRDDFFLPRLDHRDTSNSFASESKNLVPEESTGSARRYLQQTLQSSRQAGQAQDELKQCRTKFNEHLENERDIRVKMLKDDKQVRSLTLEVASNIDQAKSPLETLCENPAEPRLREAAEPYMDDYDKLQGALCELIGSRRKLAASEKETFKLAERLEKLDAKLSEMEAKLVKDRRLFFAELIRLGHPPLRQCVRKHVRTRQESRTERRRVNVPRRDVREGDIDVATGAIIGVGAGLLVAEGAAAGAILGPLGALAGIAVGGAIAAARGNSMVEVEREYERVVDVPIYESVPQEALESAVMLDTSGGQKVLLPRLTCIEHDWSVYMVLTSTIDNQAGAIVRLLQSSRGATNHLGHMVLQVVPSLARSQDILLRASMKFRTKEVSIRIFDTATWESNEISFHLQQLCRTEWSLSRPTGSFQRMPCPSLVLCIPSHPDSDSCRANTSNMRDMPMPASQMMPAFLPLWQADDQHNERPVYVSYDSCGRATYKLYWNGQRWAFNTDTSDDTGLMFFDIHVKDPLHFPSVIHNEAVVDLEGSEQKVTVYVSSGYVGVQDIQVALQAP